MVLTALPPPTPPIFYPKSMISPKAKKSVMFPLTRPILIQTADTIFSLNFEKKIERINVNKVTCVVIFSLSLSSGH